MVSEQLKHAKEMAQRLKEQQRIQRHESRKRKEVEQEEGRLARAVVREEVARMKELRVVEQAELHARKQAQRNKTQRVCTERLALAAAKKVEKARKTAERQEQQRLPAAKAAEMA
jgi:hypothetical protein